MAPAQFKALYPPEKIQLRPNVPPEIQTQAVRVEAQGYYAHTTALDRCIGELMETIADLGLRNDPIFVFTADHGEMMGSHVHQAPNQAGTMGRSSAYAVSTPVSSRARQYSAPPTGSGGES